MLKDEPAHGAIDCRYSVARKSRDEASYRGRQLYRPATFMSHKSQLCSLPLRTSRCIKGEAISFHMRSFTLQDRRDRVHSIS